MFIIVTFTYLFCIIYNYMRVVSTVFENIIINQANGRIELKFGIQIVIIT